MFEFSGNYGWKSVNRQSHHDYLLPSILSLMPKNAPLSILDAGCGNGYIAGQLSSMGHSVTAVDLSPDGIGLAREKWPSVCFQVASLYENLTPWMPHGGWDLVVSSEVIEHHFLSAAISAKYAFSPE